jgi:hypothetical protein
MVSLHVGTDALQAYTIAYNDGYASIPSNRLFKQVKESPKWNTILAELVLFL